MRLIIATRNQSKVREIKGILSGIPCEIISLIDLPDKFTIVEDGETFFENAAKKSIPVSSMYKKDYVVGEDSGLVVDYLDGEPGVYSARYSGPDATDLENNHKLLTRLKDIPQEKRKARFICCLSLALAGIEKAKFKGTLEGIINNRLQGKNGFGYDPLFCIPRLQKTTAQLTTVQKNKISHRAKAFFQLKKFLMKNC